MNKNVEPRVRTGSGPHSVRPAGTNRFGYSVGDHTTNRPGSSGYKGERLFNPERNPAMSVPFGNQKALDVGQGGCGTGRTLYGQAGSQGTHGSVNPGNPRLEMRPPQDTMSEGWQAMPIG
jgi:hypothetical protein